MVQQGLQVIQGTAGTVRELPREVAQRSTEATAEIGRALLSLAHEQTRQDLDILTALTAAVDWDKAVKAVDGTGSFCSRASFYAAQGAEHRD